MYSVLLLGPDLLMSLRMTTVYDLSYVSDACMHALLIVDYLQLYTLAEPLWEMWRLCFVGRSCHVLESYLALASWRGRTARPAGTREVESTDQRPQSSVHLHGGRPARGLRSAEPGVSGVVLASAERYNVLVGSLVPVRCRYMYNCGTRTGTGTGSGGRHRHRDRYRPPKLLQDL